MATSDRLIIPQPSPHKPLPKLNLFTMFRLGLFQMGLGIMSLLTLGIFNRIMIDELTVLPWIAATAIAMYQFVSPAKIWFGQMSDTKKIWGYHRSSYVWIGAILFTSLAFIALQGVWQLGFSLKETGWSMTTCTWAVLLGVIFALYGLALSFSSTPFAAMLVDISDEDNRSQLISIVWSMLMVGIIVGAIVSSKLLNSPDICGNIVLSYDSMVSAKTVDIPALQETVNPVFITMPAVVLGLCFVATWGIEKRYSRFGLRSITVEREDKITLGRAIRILTANRQTWLFFSFLLTLTLSLFMQDTVLEPYGGEVFGMCIAETTQLNAFYGMGTLLGISLIGFLVVPRLGKQQTIKLGCFLSIFCFGLIILAGGIESQSLLKSGLLFFGLASGVLTAGATGLMLDLTTAETAGTFIGAWGLAQAMARGFATVLGGAVLNLGKVFFSTPFLAYGLVFVAQGIGIVLTICLLGRISIQEFKNDTNSAIAAVMESDLDG
ncbi:BCD family MFS transporter [cyanobacterium endosymbiont of Epithemia clementina EcSB]|uniref:BCD family MFS transporter n=1 Tax=cyanobacterium endosymbiont of Epithemia clementina EcSB TaxID=3034674 RepID=UPI002480EF05|nr:BCD family MFS transporter [cyanobacterium endosymbiont of Epithemia clementina EcSB]WGT68204.1 BCD family MFS transporter [cyanobacterium endosymbiont of Epithemia clementina EcSB]